LLLRFGWRVNTIVRLHQAWWGIHRA
jgi:hypothetical protein